MHEFAIAENLLKIITEEAQKNGLERVTKIRLQVGKFTGVVTESLIFCFELMSEDTVAAGAAIEVEPVGVMARCEQCDFSFEVLDKIFLCPRCGQPVFELLSGRELSILSIEGETGEEDGSD